jgi:hypothetical protein
MLYSVAVISGFDAALLMAALYSRVLERSTVVAPRDTAACRIEAQKQLFNIK